MRFAGAVAAAGLAAGAAAGGNDTAPVYVTSVVTAFTTYCPEATMLTHGGETYTVSSATTLTITNCPGGCTISAPVYSSVATECSTCTPETYAPPPYVTGSSAPVVPTSYPSESMSAPYVPAPYSSESVSAPYVSTTPVVPYPPTNGTASTYAPSGTGVASGSASGTAAPPAYNGAATYGSAAGAALLAAVGFVAAL